MCSEEHLLKQDKCRFLKLEVGNADTSQHPDLWDRKQKETKIELFYYNQTFVVSWIGKFYRDKEQRRQRAEETKSRGDKEQRRQRAEETKSRGDKEQRRQRAEETKSFFFFFILETLMHIVISEILDLLIQVT